MNRCTHRSQSPTPLWLILAYVALVFCGPSVLAWELTGTVTDASDSGIEDVDIDLMDGDGLAVSLSGDLTGSDGTFTVTTVEEIPSGFYTIEFNAPDGSTYEDVTDEVFLSGDTDLGTYVMAQVFTISGTVVDEDGVAIEGIDLELFDPDGVEVEITNDDTDADGMYSIEVEEGTWSVEFRQVTASEDVFVPVLVTDIVVDGDNVVLDDVTLALGYAVTGLVEDEAGDPIVGLDIDVLDATTEALIQTPGDTSNDSGEFEIFVPAGDHLFEFKPATDSGLVPGVVLLTVEAPPTSNDMGTIVIEVGYALSGTLVDGDGLAIEGVDLDFRDSSTGEKIPLLDANSDASGDFSALVASGTYDLLIRPTFDTGFAPQVEVDVSVTEDTDVGDITLQDGIAFTGNVTDGSEAIDGVQVELYDSETATKIPTFERKSDINGDYAIRVVSGSYDVIFDPPAELLLPEASFAELDLSSDTELNVALEIPTTVSEFSCTESAGDVSLTWTNGETDYDEIRLYRGTSLIEVLSGVSTSTTDLAPGAGTQEYELVPVRGGVTGAGITCSVDIGEAPAGVSSFACAVSGQDVDLSWTNGESDYDSIEIERDGQSLATLSGTATSYEDTGLPDGTYTYTAYGVRDSANSATSECEAIVDAIPASVVDLLCESSLADISLTWTNGDTDYDTIDVYRDDVLLESLSGTAETYEDANLDDARYAYAVVPVRDTFEAGESTCSVLLENTPLPPTDLTCSVDATTISLAWTNGETDYDAVDIFRDGSFLATVTGATTAYDDTSLDAGTYEYEVIGVRDVFESDAAMCSAVVASTTEPTFVRGDANDSGRIDLSDAIFMLKYLFLDGSTPPCLAAADFNASDAVDLSDGISVLRYLFLGGDAPSDPFPDCGPNPDDATIACDSGTGCD